MTGRVPARLVDAVLALYPTAIRQRYGAEIVDLVARSPRPRRDLANVAWCALLDRAGSVSVLRLRPHLGRLTVRM